MNYPNTTPPTIPEGYTFHAPPQRHAYGPGMMIDAEASATLHEHKEKTCLKCGCVRITIIGGFKPRAWRLADSGRLVWREPVCVGVVQAANEQAA